MTYVGDFRLGDTFDIKFTTVNTSGVPTTLAGTPVISAYVGNSVTEITAGITLTVDFDARTGLHNVRVVATGANGYATASNYQLVITAGTVGGSSVVGYVIAQFSLESRSALMPTTAARTLDVSAGGEAGIDWANVGTPGSTVALSATTVGTATAVTTVNGLAAGVITAASIAADAITAAKIADGAIDAATFAAGAINAAAIAADAITDAKVAADVTIASVTGSVGSVTGSVGSVAAGGIAATSIAAGAITAAKFAAGAIDAASLATDAVNEIADGLLDRNMGTGTDSGSPTVRTVRQALRALRNRVAIAAGTATIYKEDDATASWTSTITTTAGNPISESNPADA